MCSSHNNTHVQSTYPSHIDSLSAFTALRVCTSMSSMLEMLMVPVASRSIDLNSKFRSFAVIIDPNRMSPSRSSSKGKHKGPGTRDSKGRNAVGGG